MITATAEAQIHRTQLFMRFLRQHGYAISASELQQVHLLNCTELLQDRLIYRASLRTVLCRDKTEWISFNLLFDRFWNSPDPSAIDDAEDNPEQTRTNGYQASGLAYFSESLAESEMLLGDPEEELDAQAAGGASDTRVLSQRDFRFVFRAEEMRRIEAMVDHLARRISRRARRRLETSRRRGQLDLRRTSHANLRHGGWPFALNYRRRRRSPSRFVLIMDVSQSMEVYSYLFLRFARGLLQAFNDTDAYAFHTELIAIGAELKEKSSARLEAKLRNLSSGWLGGTRISESLIAFNQRHASSTLDRNTIVLVFSDGYDSGEPEDLVEQVRMIKAKVRRVVWVNPLLGRASPDDEELPIERCIRAVQPLLDLYTSAHSVESLKNLEAAFALR